MAVRSGPKEPGNKIKTYHFLLLKMMLNSSTFFSEKLLPGNLKLCAGATESMVEQWKLQDRSSCDIALMPSSCMRRLLAHKTILQASSPTLLRVLETKSSTENEGIITLKYSYEVIDEYLRFLYEGKIAQSIKINDLCMLIEFSHEYNINNLLHESFNLLRKQLNNDTKKEILDYCLQSKVPDLIIFAFNIDCNYEKLAGKLLDEGNNKKKKQYV